MGVPHKRRQRIEMKTERERIERRRQKKDCATRPTSAGSSGGLPAGTSFRSMALHEFQEEGHENEGGEKATCGDENYVEGQWKEDDADDSTAGGEPEDDERRTTTENEERTIANEDTQARNER